MILWKKTKSYFGETSYIFSLADLEMGGTKTVLRVSFVEDIRHTLQVYVQTISNLSSLNLLAANYERKSDPTIFLSEISPLFGTEDWEVSLGEFLEIVGELWRG